MKYLMKMMFRWACAYGLALVLAVTYGFDFLAPAIDAYREMSMRQVMIYVTMAVLFLSWLAICWIDHKGRVALNAQLDVPPVPKPDTRVAMVLVYSSFIDPDHELSMPVDGAWHAQSLVDLLRCDNARVVYMNDAGEEVCMYKADEYRDLVPV